MTDESGSICGGIIKESEFKKRIKDNTIMGVMMAMVMPDKQYDKYWKLKEQCKNKEASQLFKKHAWSII